jgi:putative oxidoreductase
MNKFFSPSPVSPDYGVAAIRIITGILLINQGWQLFDAEKMDMYTTWFVDRKYPSPAAWAYAGKIGELLAGIGFALGMLTRLASVAAVASFTGIIFILGEKGKIFEGDQYPFLFILLALIFFFTGPGALSVDSIIFKKRN